MDENPYHPPVSVELSGRPRTPQRLRPLGIFVVWLFGVGLPTGIFMLVTALSFPLQVGRICLVAGLLVGWTLCGIAIVLSNGSWVRTVLFLILSLPMPFVFFLSVAWLIAMLFGFEAT